MEALGVQRMAGRILGALLVADPPEMSAEELATALQASRGSISTMTRVLEGPGLIERVRRPGDRKAYFRNKPGAWAQAMLQRNAAMTHLRILSERGLALVADAPPEVRIGIEEMVDVYRFFEREFPKLVEEWQDQHAVKRRRRDDGT